MNIDQYDYDNFITFKDKKKKIKIPDEILKSGLKINALPTEKSKIKQRKLMEQDVIPRHPSRTLFVGKSNSGKSNLMINMLVKPDMYHKYFDEIYLISPTANILDDLPKFLNLPHDRVHNELDPIIIDKIMDSQISKIEEKGIEKSPKTLIILDDIQSSPSFMRSNGLTALFVQGRHYNISTFCCIQQYKKLPKVARLQASNVFFFPSSLSEVDALVEDFTPPLMSKNDFKEMVKYATFEPYNFMHINCFCQFKERYRKNLDTMLELNV